MKLKAPNITRRSFLRGTAATIIGLPMLEFMMNDNGEAYADGTEFPCRFVFFYCPTSLVCSSSNLIDPITPTQTGMNYDFRSGLQPLIDHNLQPYVSAISGLFAAPFDAPGGYDSDYHGQGPQACVTGAKMGFGGATYLSQGVSADTLLAEAIGSQTQIDRLIYQIDANQGSDGISFGPTTSNFDGGGFRSNEAQLSPSQAYRNLFSTFTPKDPVENTAAELNRKLRVSSLSYAKDQITSLQKKLGNSDKIRLEKHFSEVRSLENKLLNTIIAPLDGSCEDPNLPGMDPANISTNVPDQAARSALFMELTAMALACDMTRTVSITSANVLTGAGMRHELWNARGGLHADVQHGSDQSLLDEANTWFVAQWADLLNRLQMFPEGPGNILDNTASVFMMEGGKGGRWADGGGDFNHSTDNMVSLLAGRAGGLVSGQHIVAQDKHPAIVMNTAMKAVGVNQTLGDIDETLDQLF